MSTHGSKKPEYSRQLLRLLSEKPAISVAEISKSITPIGKTYGITRALKGLEDGGFIERISSGKSDYARLTKEGKKKAHSIKLESDMAVINPNWDGKWRIILLDLPEERKSERDGLRYLLKKAGFILLKNSVWISPYPFEHLFMNIKKDLNLTTEIMIFVTDMLDKETEEAFRELVK